MTLLARLRDQHTTPAPYTAITFDGYALRHSYPVGERCPYCAGRLTREEWGQSYHATIGMDVCGCGFTSQRYCIA